MLGHPRGFYGLVAEGWDPTDFGNPWPRGRLPTEALAAELIVGLLDQERAAGAHWPASDFNASAATYYAQRGLPCPCVITENDLERIRDTMCELFATWDALPVGEALELRFARPVSAP